MNNPGEKVTKEIFLKTFLPIWFNLDKNVIISGFKASGLIPPDSGAVDKTKFQDTEKTLVRPTEGVVCLGRKEVAVQTVPVTVDAATQLTRFASDSFIDCYIRYDPKRKIADLM